MRGRTLFLMGMSLGLCATPLTCNWHTRPTCRGYDLVPVIVATVDMAPGTLVTFEQISQRSFPEQFVTSSVVKPDSASYIVNQRLVNAVQAGDVVRWSDFGPERALLKGQTRMFSIDVEPSRALEGLLSKADHVDVLSTVPDPVTHEKMVQTVAENVTVAGFVAHPGARTTVQLLVSGEDAQRLLLTQELGTFALSLRNPEDAESAPPGPVRLSDLLHPNPSWHEGLRLLRLAAEK